MRLTSADPGAIRSETDVLAQLLPLAGARVLDLGCGGAEHSRRLAAEAGVSAVVAAEIDAAQHAKNLASEAPTNLEFKSYGAQAIEEPDASFDVVLMFKSLHHVPDASLDKALAEIRRVLRPGGLAYISEPVFAGDFNEVIRLFHDEEQVRLAAFGALERAVASGALELVDEVFFRNRLTLPSFEVFANRVIHTTHTDHDLTPELLQRVQERFEGFGTAEGYHFEVPNRVDLLRKPSAI